ncbi:hypothetical protein B0A52_02365 [Exophiala mesophila]|uniref:Zn(2)-C6 fungal-type domain-containing protein n=1 Tax=Exophiala mesophila TaxID=212818 RepID=A0A438NC96_EXOME|nr:hypothetical protein B0A52_02365 [Exophiala mesophila]
MAEARPNASARGKGPKACSNCRRRKERCDGMQPCGRCISRNVASECQPVLASSFARSAHSAHSKKPGRHRNGLGETDLVNDATNASIIDLMDEIELQTSNQTDRSNPEHILVESPSASTYSVSRLLRDPRGRYMFIGDSANLSFLQTIRKVIKDSIGACPLTEDPLRYQMVETAIKGKPSWLETGLRQTPPRFTLAEATYLVRRYLLATNCVLDLFDEAHLLQNLPSWLERQPTETDVVSTTYYLVFALGAQTCPEDKEELAETCFSYGRYYTVVSFTEDPSISSVQAYALITMYLLNASRRNAAFMNLGTAVRAAYALGLHRKEVAALFTPTECRTRERLWKVIRILDLFMSSSLGRPPSTAETRDTLSTDNYSASMALCAIFETILNEVYSRRMISTDALWRISALHRQWTEKFQQGLAVDGISPAETVGDEMLPNIGLLHVKEAYYWTIMLLTRPFLVDAVSSYAPSAVLASSDENESCVSSCSEKTLVHACVDSAMRTIELLAILLDHNNIPKRLPFVVNSILVSALVLGLAHFGNMNKMFPVDVSLNLAHRLLGNFPHDAIARRNMTIVGHLIQACQLFNEKRSKSDRERQALLVGKLFGKIHETPLPAGSGSARSKTDNLSASTISGLRGPPQDQTIQAQQPSSEQNDHDHDHNQQSLQTQFGTNSQPSYQELNFVPGSSPGHTETDVMSDQFKDADLMFDAFEESMPPMLPRTLWFDPYVEEFPFFSTLDTSMT